MGHAPQAFQWAITCNLHLRRSEAAPLRCLSDVVDAGDRNEIDIAEERSVGRTPPG